jgi:hypothetical protein
MHALLLDLSSRQYYQFAAAADRRQENPDDRKLFQETTLKLPHS